MRFSIVKFGILSDTSDVIMLSFRDAQKDQGPGFLNSGSRLRRIGFNGFGRRRRPKGGGGRGNPVRDAKPLLEVAFRIWHEKLR